MPTCPTCRKQYPEGTTTCAIEGAELMPDVAFASAETTLEKGTRVGEYEIEGLLGEGTFGAVYRAVHPVIGKAAAIKVLKREFSAKPEMVSRFIAEARAVNQIRNRNIIDIFNFGVHEDGRHYYVMELLDGMTLDEYVRQRGRLTPAEALPILKQLARALGAAHAAGIAHRDLKPENVFLAFDDGAPIPKLLDFGLAKLVDDSAAQHKTKSGIPMGTPLYMSPEQVHGIHVDHRADIYSFGILTFELLTGRLPFDGTSVMDLMMKQVSAKAPPVSSVAHELPPELDAPILAMMEKDPAKRPDSVVAAVDDLAAIVARLGLASGPGSSGPGAILAEPRVVGARSAKDVGVDSGAATVIAPPGSQSLGASIAEPARERPRWPLYAAIGTSLLALAGGALLLRGSASGGSAETHPAPTATVTATATATATGPIVSPSGEPSATATPSAAPTPAAVKLKLKITPADSEVFAGTKRLGLATDALELPRGTAPVKLKIKHEGYLDGSLDVTPSDDVVDALILKPAPRKEYTF